MTYTLLFSFLCPFFGKWQIRFSEHRKTKSNRIWHILYSIFGCRMCRIRPNISQAWHIHSVPYTVRHTCLNKKIMTPKHASFFTCTSIIIVCLNCLHLAKFHITVYTKKFEIFKDKIPLHCTNDYWGNARKSIEGLMTTLW